MRRGADDPDSRALLALARSTVDHNARMRANIRFRAASLHLPTDKGFRKFEVVPWEQAPVHRVISRIVRGAYLKARGRILDPSARIACFFPDDLPEDRIFMLTRFAEMLRDQACTNVCSADPEIFGCRFGVARDSEDATQWLLFFLQRVVVGVITLPPEPDGHPA